MATKELINKLHSIFCDVNKQNKRYSEIWLTEADFGGLYNSGKYVLNLKTEQQYEIYSCGQEIQEILSLLDEKAKEELDSIVRVDIYDADQEIHCQSDEIMVYGNGIACSN